MTSYQYRKSHCGDKTILRPSYLHYGISYADKMTSFYWIRAQAASVHIRTSVNSVTPDTTVNKMLNCDSRWAFLQNWYVNRVKNISAQWQIVPFRECIYCKRAKIYVLPPTRAFDKTGQYWWQRKLNKFIVHYERNKAMKWHQFW